MNFIKPGRGVFGFVTELLSPANPLACGMRFNFQKEPARRRISIHYEAEDLERDVETLSHFLKN